MNYALQRSAKCGFFQSLRPGRAKTVHNDIIALNLAAVHPSEIKNLNSERAFNHGRKEGHKEREKGKETKEGEAGPPEVGGLEMKWSRTSGFNKRIGRELVIELRS